MWLLLEKMKLILIASLISFFVTLIAIPKLIRYLKLINLEVKDMNKQDKPLIPLSGGIAVMAGIFIAIMFYMFIQTFIYENKNSLIYILAALITIVMITFIGFIDDLLIKKNKESSYGLKQWQKPLFTLVAAIPLMAVNAGSNIIKIPFMGRVEIALYYPLILVPIGIIGAANMVNLLGGFNGLEAGMGLVYTGMLSLYAYINNKPIGLLFSLITFSALIAFYIYNKYPAKIFPGDSLTYLLGATLACIAILGDMERAALICSIPFFIELILKARSKFKAETYGYYKEGKIHSQYTKIYSIPHIFTRIGKFTEKQITYFLILIELIFANLIWFV